MGTLFGEIIEPSTRAFINDDCEEYPQYISHPIECEGDSAVPSQIHTLIFTETENVRKTLKSCVLQDQKPILKILNAGVEVFHLNNNVYLVSLWEYKQLTVGQIVEEFGSWIKIAEHVYAMTSEHIANFKNGDLDTRPPSLVRMLSTDFENKFSIQRLDPPNLVTGLGAAVLTYCVHNRLSCTLFVIYIDNVPVDSINMGPFLELLEKIHVNLNNKLVHMSLNSSNLYM